MGARIGVVDGARRLLLGDAVDVEVEPLERGGAAQVEFDLKNATDISARDFYFPLVIFFAIIVLNEMPPMGTVSAFVLNLILLLDLLNRVRRRPSGEAAVGLRPPLRQPGWWWVWKTYLASAPLLFAALWLNFRLAFWLASLAEPNGASAGVAAIAPPLWLGTLLFFVRAAVLAPFTEEIWFRGIGLVGFIKRGSDPLLAVVWTSLIFGLMHGPERFMFAALFGFVLSMIRLRTGSLYCCLAVHSLHNFLFVGIGMLL